MAGRLDSVAAWRKRMILTLGAAARPVAALLFALCAGAIVLVAQQRIFTNPKPEAHLKHLFPNAVAFSPLQGTPLHFNAFGVDPAKDPSAKPIGLAFWTTDLVPQEHGYHGPIYILVGMDMSGTLTGVVVDYHSEPYGYFSVEPEKFAAQFKGKKITDPFRVGGDVDAVSRASLSITSATRAIRDSSRMVARQLLNPGPRTNDAVNR
ncbi:MAG TPA: FMN-binding protein [Vicinamibacterales bacterium]|jgi:transcriptional regulator of nitric oxide reductase|nr:FMN-binding protein [Vicinamibacterales bacterium]